MTAAGAKPKYLMISVFPKDAAWAGQGALELEIQIGAFKWGAYTLTTPPKPTSALYVDSQSQAFRLLWSTASLTAAVSALMLI